MFQAVAETRFDGVNDHFIGVRDSLRSVENRFDGVDTKFNSMGSRLDSMDTRTVMSIGIGVAMCVVSVASVIAAMVTLIIKL